MLSQNFVLEPRGAIQIKGVGEIETWLLKEERARGTREASA
jgi:hypothetical protein